MGNGIFIWRTESGGSSFPWKCPPVEHPKPLWEHQFLSAIWTSYVQFTTLKVITMAIYFWQFHFLRLSEILQPALELKDCFSNVTFVGEPALQLVYIQSPTTRAIEGHVIPSHYLRSLLRTQSPFLVTQLHGAISTVPSGIGLNDY